MRFLKKIVTEEPLEISKKSNFIHQILKRNTTGENIVPKKGSLK